jgi:hypothetical protein
VWPWPQGVRWVHGCFHHNPAASALACLLINTGRLSVIPLPFPHLMHWHCPFACTWPHPPPPFHIHPPFTFCQVYLATTGEMSGTILAYPNSHYRLIDQLKDVATEGNPIWRDNMQVTQCRPLSQCLTASARAPLGTTDSPSIGSHAGLHPVPVS